MQQSGCASGGWSYRGINHDHITRSPGLVIQKANWKMAIDSGFTHKMCIKWVDFPVRYVNIYKRGYHMQKNPMV